MEGYPGETSGEAMNREWGEHIAASQAPGFEWDPLTGYSPEQLQANATAAQATGEGADLAPVESTDERKPGEREFGPATRKLTATQIVNLGKPVVHSTQEQPVGDNSITYQVPADIIDKL